jgi:ArsR family transcriptional regulator, arsenate/arsenite/antimonite-responsive transcriptional repressor
MTPETAVSAFGALAQDTRLSVFRMLVRAGPEGLSAGEIAATAETSAPTMSHHLAILERSGLARSTRHGRSIRYAADYDGTRRLLAFLTEDCCQGRPEICGVEIAPKSPDPAK